MSHLSVLITDQAPTGHWSPNAIVTFDANNALIHIDSGLDGKSHLRRIQKAARILDNMQIDAVRFEGNWDTEQQWAFAYSFVSPKKTKHFEWCSSEHADVLEARLKALIFTRDLVNATPEALPPVALANAATDWISSLATDSVTSKVISGEALLDAGWVGIYNVGRGSERPPALLELDFNPTGDPDAPVSAALVGKGITFDSGGYSIKSSEGMLDMKCDMGGAATVTGALGLAIMSGLSSRVKLFLCCAENLISGHAYKLGDVLTYKNGVSVEIVNTDAEGRLVLADGLMAAADTGAPFILNAATLTGAAVMALGNEYNAVFALDDKVRAEILSIAESENELAWPLPLNPWHQEKCPSRFADTANSKPQKGGGPGGASNAAGFLSRFVPRDGKGWVHMDLAAAYNGNATDMMPAGATGQGIRTIAKAILAL